MKTSSSKIVAGAIPKYRQLLFLLRNQILSGELPPGKRLPSEEDLSSTYGLSRGTIRKAIAQLEAERLIETEHGIGSFVRAAHPQAIPFHFALPYPAEIQASIKHKVIAQEVILAPMHITEQLHLPPGSRVIHIARQQLVNGKVAAYSERYLAEEIMPSLANRDLTGIVSLHDLLVEESEFPLLQAQLEIEAHCMNQEEAELLEAEVGEPAIVIKRLTYTAPNRPAVWYFGLYKREYNLTIRISDKDPKNE